MRGTTITLVFHTCLGGTVIRKDSPSSVTSAPAARMATPLLCPPATTWMVSSPSLTFLLTHAGASGPASLYIEKICQISVQAELHKALGGFRRIIPDGDVILQTRAYVALLLHYQRAVEPSILPAGPADERGVVGRGCAPPVVPGALR